MLLIVIAGDRTRHFHVVVIVVMVNVINAMAIVVVLHICSHVCLIMPQMIRRMVSIVMREMIPVVRRTPVRICRTAKAVEQRRTIVEHRFDNIIRTVNIWRTYNLHIRRSIAHLHNQSCHILIDIGGEYSLNEHHVRTSVQGLKYAQVVDVTIVIEVKVGDDVRL